jgi:hypothetical protein
LALISAESDVILTVITIQHLSHSKAYFAIISAIPLDNILMDSIAFAILSA